VTKFFRPPKSLLYQNIKEKIRSMGYKTILWSINSKDWVAFHHQDIVRYISQKVVGGDIILFHDSGDVFKPEGGDRSQTVLAIPLLAKALRDKGYKFVSLEELLNG
jgi:peptidoglycan/xylan/chitin deacetylase (PgdA/CDA1 family)